MNLEKSHAVPIDDILGNLGTDLTKGISQAEAAARLEIYGRNELEERARATWLQLLLAQFQSFLIILLIVAAIISLVLGEVIDASAILAIVILNAVLGVVQESKAEQALAALKKMAAPLAVVLREGQKKSIPSAELVPGDMVLLEAGNYVPADLRLVETVNLKVDEASLTGESVPVEKNAEAALEEDAPLGDRRNSAFMSTLITYGRGKGVVIHTGMSTQIGHIAEMLQSYEDEATPLQQKLDQLGRTLGMAALAICGFIFLYGLIRDTQLGQLFTEGAAAYFTPEHTEEIVELFMIAISLAIAAVPEGLPAVVTICLALGMQRMIKRNALIRKLPAVETLGSATVICSDKTGTLTQNEMMVVRGWASGHEFEVTGQGYRPEGTFSKNGAPCDPLSIPATSILLHTAVLCNDANLNQERDENGEEVWKMIGDPTEGALVVAAAKAGLEEGALDETFPRIQEVPFDSDRKRMATIHQVANETDMRAFAGTDALAPLGLEGKEMVALVKGAPDIILDRCQQILVNGELHPLSEAERERVLGANQNMARQALRVLGIAYRPLDALPDEINPDTIEKDLVFVGLLGMIDPPRPEIRDAVARARGAGLKSIMVTGDFKETAVAIARQIGLISEGDRALSGAELNNMSDEELTSIVGDVGVFARVAPEHKVRIVDALKQRDQVVAMTGDGVNDAPALKRANIGVAMGITGTDVTKQTADMVLTDDNYASIVSAIEEGRVIYSNIRKFVFYLVSCNIGEILIIFLSMLGGLPIPLRPIQLLLLNLVTDGAPALALGLEKGDPDIMKYPPRPTREPVINGEMQIGIVVQSVVMTIAVLVAFIYGLRHFPGDLETAQSMAFATLVVSELLRAFTARSEYHFVFSKGFFSNKWMWLAVASSLVLLLVVLYVPFIQTFMGTVGLTWSQWTMVLPLTLLASIAAEITKYFLKRRRDNGQPAVATT
jgi:P-type Ca2+ transporter type 2C